MSFDQPTARPPAGRAAPRLRSAGRAGAEREDHPGQDGHHEARVAVERAWGLLYDQSDAIADNITLTLFERDAERYARFGPELRADVRESTREHIRWGLGVLSGHREQMAQAEETWRETGRRRARQGVPLETTLNAYITGSRILWEALVSRARADDEAQIDAAMLIRAAKAVWSNIDLQNGVLIEAYHRESARLQRQDLQRQQAVLDGLLEGRGGDPEYAHEAREALRLDHEDPVACVVVLSHESPGDSLTVAEDRLDRLGVRAYWHLRGGVYLGLLAGPLPSEAELVEIFETAPVGRIGVGRCPDGIAGFATAFQLATRAAETLPRHEHGVVAIGDRLPEVLLAGSPQVMPLLMAQTLAPLEALPEAQGRTLIETLAALLRHDGSPTHAAEDLYCHRNTVIYRLRQIEELTGRSLTDPRDKLLLSLAMMARRSGT